MFWLTEIIKQTVMQTPARNDCAIMFVSCYHALNTVSEAFPSRRENQEESIKLHCDN